MKNLLCAKGGDLCKNIYFTVFVCLLGVVFSSIRTYFVNHRRRTSSTEFNVFFLYICSLHVVCYREGETAGPGSKSDGKHPKVALSAGGSLF